MPLALPVCHWKAGPCKMFCYMVSIATFLFLLFINGLASFSPTIFSILQVDGPLFILCTHSNWNDWKS